jgi:hypothetical protein
MISSARILGQSDQTVAPSCSDRQTERGGGAFIGTMPARVFPVALRQVAVG